MAGFKEQMSRYQSLLKCRAVREQVINYLAKFVSSDTRRATEQILVKEGEASIVVDENTIERFIEQLEEEVANINKQLEEL